MASVPLLRETCNFSGLFCFQTNLPGKYRNGVVLAFCNLAISVMGGEQLIHWVLYV